MEILRGHWPTISTVLLAVMVVALVNARCSDVPQLRAEVEAARAEAARDSANALRWRDVAYAAQAEREVLRDRANDARARADSLDALTPAVIVRWDTLPDTASVATVRATADSVIRHLTDVGEHWRAAYMARTEELRATQRQLTATEHERDAHERRAQALGRAVDALEAQLEGSRPWWSTAAITAGSAAIGYAVDGVDGALKFGAGGLAVSVVWHGLDDFIARPW